MAAPGPIGSLPRLGSTREDVVTLSSRIRTPDSPDRRTGLFGKVLFRYLPILGAASHTLFAVHTIDRTLLLRLFPRWHLGFANGLLFNSHLGVGLYIYNRKFMRPTSTTQRIIWSVYGSAMFNFGSVLLFATGKQLLADDRLVTTLYAVSASLCFLVVGRNFFDYLDFILCRP